MSVYVENKAFLYLTRSIFTTFIMVMSILRYTEEVMRQIRFV